MSNPALIDWIKFSIYERESKVSKSNNSEDILKGAHIVLEHGESQ